MNTTDRLESYNINFRYDDNIDRYIKCLNYFEDENIGIYGLSIV